MKGVVTYELADGRRVALDARAAREHGAATILREMGLADQIPTSRVTVMWHSRAAGTVPGDFDPSTMKSRNYFYDVRPGDFVREGDVWIANRTLGPSDLEAVPGFSWNHGIP